MIYRPLIDRFMEKVELIPFHDCWEWMAQLNNKGYGVIWVSTKDGCHLAHRISYTLFVGNVPAGKFVCHKCDNPSCVNPRHLWLGSAKENTGDMMSKNRVAKGLMQVGRRKLSVDDVRAIRAEYKRGVLGYGLKAIAKRRDMSVSAIRAIVTSQTWWYID